MEPIRYSEEQVLSWARQGYEAGRAGLEVEPQRSALLVIDMQDEFVAPEASPFWVPAATRQLERVGRLVECCRQLRVPVIFTVFANTHQRLDRPATLENMPLTNPPAGDDLSQHAGRGRVCDRLAPLPGEVVIEKPSYGAFRDTPLETILRNLARDTVIICGTLSNYCCGTTARQAYERGFQVVFGSDVTATDLPEAHEAELRVLRRGFALVMTGAEIERALRAAPGADDGAG